MASRSGRTVLDAPDCLPGPTGLGSKFLVCELSGPVDKEVEDVAHRIDHHPHVLLRLPLRLSGAE